MIPIYKHILQVVVLTERKDIRRLKLHQVRDLISHGDAVGQVTLLDSKPLPAHQVRPELRRIGNDGSFFDLRADLPHDPVIAAEVHSDDFAKQAGFDAEPWFQQARDQQILALARCDWRADYPADEVAQFIRPHDPQVEAVFDYLETVNICQFMGFECSVHPQDAMAWLRWNRPALASHIQQEVS